MFKKLIVLTAILLSGSKESFLPLDLITEIKGDEIELAVTPINKIMASRFIYTALDPKYNISFNTFDRNYNFSKGLLENKIDDSIVSIPTGERYSLIQAQMDYLVELGFFVKDKNFIFEGNINLKGFFKDSIKVISNGKVVEETKKAKGAQYKITELGVENIAKKNETILIYLGYLKAEIIKLTKNHNKNIFNATYTLYLDGIPDWLNKNETIDLFPNINQELTDIEKSSIKYDIKLINKNNMFEITKGSKQDE